MLEVGGLFLDIFEREKKNWIFQFLTKGTPCLQNKSHKNIYGMIKSQHYQNFIL